MEQKYPEAEMLPAFPFLAEKNHRISLVGAGGKTTLMYAMAEAYCQRGCKVLVTTTTHIKRPADEYRAKSPGEAMALWQKRRFAVAGEDAPEGKLKGLETARLKEFMAGADIVLIEADGAKGRPCKVPASHEPVLLEESDIVIGVAGMDSIGRPLKEVCFRLEQAEAFLRKEQTECLTEEDLTEILSSSEGTRKGVGDRGYYVILNKASDERRRQSAKRIAALLKSRGIENVGIT